MCHAAKNNQPTNQPTSQQIHKSTHQPTKQLADQQTNQPTNQWTNQKKSTYQPTNQNTSQPNSQPMNQPAKESTDNQQINQPTNQPIKGQGWKHNLLDEGNETYTLKSEVLLVKKQNTHAHFVDVPLGLLSKVFEAKRNEIKYIPIPRRTNNYKGKQKAVVV